MSWARFTSFSPTLPPDRGDLLLDLRAVDVVLENISQHGKYGASKMAMLMTRHGTFHVWDLEGDVADAVAKANDAFDVEVVGVFPKED